MRDTTGKWSRILTAIGLAIGLAFTRFAGLGAYAQDDDANSRTYLYEGNVDDLENARMIVELNDLDDFYDDDHWAVLGNNKERPSGPLSTDDEIDDDYNLSVQSLVAGEYMVVVHESDDTKSPIIAAGNIEGTVTDGSVLFELEEIDRSGFEGRAYITPEDDDDIYELDVTVGIFPVGSVEPLELSAPEG